MEATINQRLSLWAPFVMASALTFAIYISLFWFYWYPNRPVLGVLGIVSIIAATRIIIRTGPHWLTLLVIAFGLLIGQWWIVSDFIVMIWWSIVGFAP
jgi:hypothetical protein